MQPKCYDNSRPVTATAGRYTGGEIMANAKKRRAISRLLAAILTFAMLAASTLLPGCALLEKESADAAVSAADAVSQTDEAAEEDAEPHYPAQEVKNDYLIPEDIDYSEGTAEGKASICRVGNWIYYQSYSQKKNKRISLDGSSAESLVHVLPSMNYISFISLEHDGKLYLVTDGVESNSNCSKIVRFDPTDGSTAVIARKKDDDVGMPEIKTICTDGVNIYYLVDKYGWDDFKTVSTTLYSVAIDGGEAKKICEFKSSDNYVNCLNGFAARDGKIYMAMYQPKEYNRAQLVEISAKSGKIKEITRWDSSRVSAPTGVSIVGDRLCVTSGDDMFTCNFDGSDKITLPKSAKADRVFWRGSKAYYSVQSEGIYCHDFAVNETTQIYEGQVDLCGVDCNWVYFCPAASFEIYRVRLDGTGKNKLP